MTPFLLAAALFISFASSSLLVPVVRRVALGHGWVDMPDDERKKHAHPTPNVGGIAIVLGFAIGLISLLFIGKLFSVSLSLPHWAFFVGGLVIALLGVYDDVHGLSFKRKFFFQIVVAYLLLYAGYRIDVTGFPFIGTDPGFHALISIPLTVFWIVGIINAVNLLDGLDGLASGVSIIAFACLATIFGIQGGDIGIIAVALLVIGATAGFLVFNFNPASIFMGDSGSLFLGYMLAMYSMQGSAHSHPLLAFFIPAVALGLPILDTILCMFRRSIDGISPFSPDSDHIHHRLSKLWSTRGAVLILYAVSLWFGIAAILISQFELVVGLLMVCVTMIAGFVGISTLGYLNLRQIVTKKRKIEPQLALEFAQNGDQYEAEILDENNLEVVSSDVSIPLASSHGGDGGAAFVRPAADKVGADQFTSAKTNGHSSNDPNNGTPDRGRVTHPSTENEKREKLELIPPDQ